EAEAAEAMGKESKSAKKAAPKKKAAKRKSRAKQPVDQRIKLFWGVFNQSLRRVALYEFNQKKQAQAKADELSKGGKSPHFVQKVKEAVEEA
ncbi:MAG: hypothetical protein KDA41_11465, partial [Planctomycetales bacterium]|nr:hypothetical protein [Planctomycetales bacterium]